VRIFRASVPDNVEIEEHYSFSGGTVMASASQLHRAIMNVLTNSMNAMSDTGAIWICIAENKDVSQEILSQMRQPAARICEIAISDTGCGIAREHLEHIFEPFFSHGSDSKNAGMGLAVTYRIIHEIGGAIEVESAPGEGTSFHVYLPVIQPLSGETAGDGIGICPGRPSSPIHVLFVDDEQMICSVARGMLNHLGYKVTTFQRSFEALAAFRNQPEIYDFIISDQTMAGMTGLEIVSEIRTINQEIPIILCSGYISVIDVDVMNSLRISTLLEKPFTRETLGNAVSAALYQRRSGLWKE
jgi:CheY-like chemotaxis protein